MHDPGQRYVLGFQGQVDVVAHEDIGVEDVMITVFVNGEEFVIFIVIRGILEYLKFLVAAQIMW